MTPPRRAVPGGVPLLAALLACLLVAAGAARAQPSATLRGEVGVDAGVAVVTGAGAAQARVPVVVRARIELDARASDAFGVRVVASPALGAGLGPDDPLVRAGLQEAYLRAAFGSGALSGDLTAGLQRWPVGEARLAPIVRWDGRLSTGEPRGLAGVRATAYRHPWRLRAGVAAPTGDDVVPDRWGAAASLRWDGPATLEAHAFATDRPGVGASASGTAGDVVVYGEAWLLADPWEVRAGAGVTGYAGDVLWTAEAAWAPADGALTAPARPAGSVSASASLPGDAALEAVATVSAPASTAGDGGRTIAVDLGGELRWDRPEATLALRPSLRIGDGVVVGGATVSITSWF